MHKGQRLHIVGKIAKKVKNDLKMPNRTIAPPFTVGVTHSEPGPNGLVKIAFNARELQSSLYGRQRRGIRIFTKVDRKKYVYT